MEPGKERTEEKGGELVHKKWIKLPGEVVLNENCWSKVKTQTDSLTGVHSQKFPVKISCVDVADLLKTESQKVLNNAEGCRNGICCKMFFQPQKTQKELPTQNCWTWLHGLDSWGPPGVFDKY